MLRLRKLLRLVWHYLREACGENDYARYGVRAQTRGEPAMSPKDFYLWRLGKKYSGISRCC